MAFPGLSAAILSSVILLTDSFFKSAATTNLCSVSVLMDTAESRQLFTMRVLGPQDIWEKKKMNSRMEASSCLFIKRSLNLFKDN